MDNFVNKKKVNWHSDWQPIKRYLGLNKKWITKVFAWVLISLIFMMSLYKFWDFLYFYLDDKSNELRCRWFLVRSNTSIAYIIWIYQLKPSFNLIRCAMEDWSAKLMCVMFNNDYMYILMFSSVERENRKLDFNNITVSLLVNSNQ